MDSGCFSGADDSFGPGSSCHGYRDFTLFFEQTILSIGPSALFIVACIWRAYALSKEAVKVSHGFVRIVQAIKFSVFLVLIACQMVLIALWLRHSDFRGQASVPAAVIGLVAALVMPLLYIMETVRAANPSTIITLYTGFSSLLDMAQVRTLWLRGLPMDIASVSTFATLCKLLILALEMKSKREILKAPYRDWPPEALAGIVNRAVFWWINEIMINGSRSILQTDNLFMTDNKLRSVNLHKQMTAAWSSCFSLGKHSLMVTSMWCFRSTLSKIIIPRVCLIGFKFSQPLLLTTVLDLLSQPESQDKRETGWYLVLATALIYLGMAISTAAFRHQIYRSMTALRGALAALIYSTTLKLSAAQVGESAALTLMSTDVDRIVLGLQDFDSLFAAPIEITLAIYLLYGQLGPACFVPVVVAILSTIGAFLIGDVTIRAQKRWVDAVELRVSSTASALNSLKAVRMTGLVDFVIRTVQNLRKVELEHSANYRKATTARNAISNFSLIMTPSLTFLSYVLISRTSSGVSLTPAVAFTSLSLISLLSSAIQYWAWAIPTFMASAGCYTRIQDYLMLEDSQRDARYMTYHEVQSLKEKQHPDEPRHLLEIRDGSFAYSREGTLALHDINLTVARSSISMVLGPVGSGKSTLLKAILGEVVVRQGSVHAPAVSVAYCSQDTWLPSSSIQDIVTGTTLFDQDWFKTVLFACALDEDISNFAGGVDTKVSSKGASLSGGQRQRLALARAIYSRSKLIMIDDFSSGLDKRTEKMVFQRLLGHDGLCRRLGMTVVLATHAVKFLELADYLMILDINGMVLTQGPRENIMSQKDQILTVVGSDVTAVSENDTKSSPTKDIDIKETAEDFSRETIPNNQELDTARQSGDWKVYAYYFRAIGQSLSALFILSLVLVAFGIKFPTVWMKWWSEEERYSPGTRTMYYMGIMVAFGAIGMLAMIVAVGLLSVVITPRTGKKIHQSLLSTVMHAPHLFITTVDTGITLNRFSQDISLIDVQLPNALLQTLDGAFICLFEAGLIISSDKYMAVTIPFSFAVLYLLQKFYLRTSRQVRLLDIEAKAPLYTNFMETADGIETIRAFGWQKICETKNFDLLDVSQKPYYMLFCVQRWLNLVLDLVVAAFAVLVVVLATQLPGSSAGALGVALTNLLTFNTSLAYLVEAWAILETSMGAIARVTSFVSTTPSELISGEPSRSPSPCWPASGRVVFEKVTAHYKPGPNAALQDINLTIRAGDKVAIVGRTGGGKSSLLLAILRMLNLTEGTISIDDVSLADLPAERIRKSIITIPQEPFIHPQSIVRVNADPSASLSDETVLAALHRVGLSDVLGSRGGSDALGLKVEALSMTPGQKKLFGLAQALLRRSSSGREAGVVLVDEITSGVDEDLETSVTKILREEFRQFTVIAVAHRLSAIRDFNTVVVMNQGQIVETGQLDALLESSDSAFASLIRGETEPAKRH